MEKDEANKDEEMELALLLSEEEENAEMNEEKCDCGD